MKKGWAGRVLDASKSELDDIVKIPIQVVYQDQVIKHLATPIGQDRHISGPVFCWSPVTLKYGQGERGIIINDLTDHFAVFPAGERAFRMTEDSPDYSTKVEPCPASLRPFLVARNQLMDRVRQMVKEFRDTGNLHRMLTERRRYGDLSAFTGKVPGLLYDQYPLPLPEPPLSLPRSLEHPKFSAETIQDTGSELDAESVMHKREDLLRAMLQRQLIDTGVLIKLGFGHAAATDFFIPYKSSPEELDVYRRTGRHPFVFGDPQAVAQSSGIPINIKRLHKANDDDADDQSHEKMGEMLIPRDDSPTLWLIDSMAPQHSIDCDCQNRGIQLLMIPSDTMRFKYNPDPAETPRRTLFETWFYTLGDIATDSQLLRHRISVPGGLDSLRVQASDVGPMLLKIFRANSTEPLTGISTQEGASAGIVTTLQSMLDIQVNKKRKYFSLFAEQHCILTSGTLVGVYKSLVRFTA